LQNKKLDEYMQDLDNRLSDIDEMLSTIKSNLQTLQKQILSDKRDTSYYAYKSKNVMNQNEMYVELLRIFGQLQSTAISTRLQQIKLLSKLDTSEDQVKLDPRILTQLQKTITVIGGDDGED